MIFFLFKVDSFFSKVPKQPEEFDKENIEMVSAAGDSSEDNNRNDKVKSDDIVENQATTENIDHKKESKSENTITFDSEITLSQNKIVNVQNKTVDIVFDNVESLSQSCEASNNKKTASTIVFDDFKSLSQQEKRNSLKETKSSIIFDDFDSLSQPSKSSSNKKSTNIIFDDFQSLSQVKYSDEETVNNGLKISFDSPETLSQSNSNVKVTFDDSSLSNFDEKSYKLDDSKSSVTNEASSKFNIKFDNIDTFNQAKATVDFKDNSAKEVKNSIELSVNIDDSKAKARKEVNICFSMDKMKSSIDAIKNKDEENKETELKFSAKINPQVKNEQN